MNIGQAVRTLRRKHGMTQSQLAEYVGASQSLLSLVEKGDREPSFQLIAKIAGRLKVPEQLIFLMACDQQSRGSRYKKPLRRIASALDDLLIAATPKRERHG